MVDKDEQKRIDDMEFMVTILKESFPGTMAYFEEKIRKEYEEKK